jgi:hypothetical protein
MDMDWGQVAWSALFGGIAGGVLELVRRMWVRRSGSKSE